MEDINPFLLADGYKTGHHKWYPENIIFVYSNFTARSNMHAEYINVPKNVVVFGINMAMREIDRLFKRNFFDKPKDEVCSEIKVYYENYLGLPYNVKHIEELHDLQYLPIRVKSLAEGTLCPIGVPFLTISNTLPKFFWITNFLETILSNLIWKPITSATIAHEYRKIIDSWSIKTHIDNQIFVNYQGHDFSMRGMDSIWSTASSGLGHSLSFIGSDSLPVLHAAKTYYPSANKNESVIISVPATEHSVMSAGATYNNDGTIDELDTFKRLLKGNPIGVLSIVSDTFDLWKVLKEYLPKLKEEILARNGKLIIRPDSGNPVDIICGTYVWKNKQEWDEYNSKNSTIQAESVEGEDWVQATSEEMGVIEMLWETFGGTINAQGYKVLDSHIGAIYGDSITLDRADEICRRLAKKGFASTNVVLGIGSYTYGYNTRDTLGMAMKATYFEVLEPKERADKSIWYEAVGKDIFKDPVTDDGTKKSLRGLIRVDSINEYEKGIYKIRAFDKQSRLQEETGLLKTMYLNGDLKSVGLDEIREKLKSESVRVLEYSDIVY